MKEQTIKRWEESTHLDAGKLLDAVRAVMLGLQLELEEARETGATQSAQVLLHAAIDNTASMALALVQYDVDREAVGGPA